MASPRCTPRQTGVRQSPPFDPYAPALFQFINRLITPIIDLGYSSKTPNAGPHFAPGGALVNNNGQPVFTVRRPLRPLAKLPTTQSAVKAAVSALRPTTPGWARVARRRRGSHERSLRITTQIVEPRRFELLTSALQRQRSTN